MSADVAALSTSAQTFAAGDGARPPPRRLVSLLIALELALFAAAGYLAHRFVAETRANRAWVEHAQRVMTAFDDMRLVNARLGATALYYLNGDTGQRGPQIRLEIEDVRRRLDELQSLVGDDPAQLERLRFVTRQLETRMRVHERIVNEVAPGDAAAARPLVTDLSRTADPIRVAVAAVNAEMRSRLEARNRATDASLRRSLVLLVTAFAAAFLFGGIATLLFLNQFRLQRGQWLELARANAEIARQAHALRHGRRRLNAVLDNARDGIVLLSHDLEITMANDACTSLLGMRRDDMVGRRLGDFLPDFEVSDGKIWRNQAVRADGSSFPAEVSVGRCQLDDGPATVCVLRDVSERRRLEQVKDEFISTVSHELRTPLTSIRGSLGLVVGRAAGELPAKARALLEIADKNCARLIDLVNDLLDIEKIEAHRIAMRREPVEVAGLIAAAVEANGDLARQGQVRIEVADRTAGGLQVMGDAGRLQQVLTNLLSNAVKFSPSDERIVVSIDSDAACVTVAVRDFGAGINDAFKPHVFERFAQAEAGDARRGRGTGLGLSIVKSIVEHHGGKLGFETKLPGGGTRFWFTLKHLGPALASRAAAADDRPRVLVCEDNALIAQLIAATVEQDGWQAVTVASAEAALSQLAAHPFAAMTVDLKLPTMSGVELIRRVGADERHRAMPILVVSATASQQRGELDGYAARLVDWIEKPFQETKLRGALLAAVEGRRQDGVMRILHVENDEDLVAVVREVIGDSAEVETAYSMQAARELLVQRRFDLVILDVQLPDGNGLDLVPLLQSTHRRAALLILSASDVPEGGFGMVQASLTKGRADNARLAQTIGRLLGQARQQA